MGKVFTPQSFLKETSSMFSIRVEDPSQYTRESYFVEGLDFLTEMHKESIAHRAQLYRVVAESGNDLIAMHEGFSDFFGWVKDFLKKVINFFKKLIAKFWVRINSLFLRDKYITKHKDSLKEFGSEHEFDFKGYEYSFNPSIPNLQVLTTFADEMNELVVEAANKKEKDSKNELKDKNGLKAAYSAFKTKRSSSGYLNDIRYKILTPTEGGKKSGISESDYKDELFKIYRSGDMTASTITATSTLVNKSLFDFEHYEKDKKLIEREKDTVEKEYKTIQKQFDAVHTAIFGAKSGEDVEIDDVVFTSKDDDRQTLIDIFAKEKSTEIQEISFIHIMAFTAKLDALKDRYTQDKNVLYTAFKKILAKEKMFATKEAAEEIDDDIKELEEHSDIGSIIDTHVRDSVPDEDTGETASWDNKKDNDDLSAEFASDDDKGDHSADTDDDDEHKDHDLHDDDGDDDTEEEHRKHHHDETDRGLDDDHDHDGDDDSDEEEHEKHHKHHHKHDDDDDEGED